MKSLFSFSQHPYVASLLILGSVASTCVAEAVREEDRRYPEPIGVNVPHVSTDKSVKYDIVFVRTPRQGDEARSLWTEIAHPAMMDAGGDLVLLHPDGREEVLVAGGEDGSVTDPMVSFDGEWVFYSQIKGLKGTSQHGQPPLGGADIYKIHVRSRKIVRLTHGKLTPNTGAADWAADPHQPTNDKTWHNYGVLNMGPCPLPGGRLMFTSSRNGFIPPKHPSPCQQLFVMDDDGRNVEMIGHLNIGMALHPVNAEYHRDVKPILLRSCAVCHSHKLSEPAGQLVLDGEQPVRVTHGPEVPETYYRLALDQQAKYGYKPVIHNGSWRQTNASRYIRKFQSRRSLLVWKIYGRRTDGWSNDDFPTAEVPGDANTLKLQGKPIENTQRNRDRSDLDYDGRAMPPPNAVAGKYVGPRGEKIQVAPLSDEDRRTLVRWIDLGCPIDLDYDPARPDQRGYGWMVDDNRPVLNLTHPRRGVNRELDRIVVGMYDYYTGLDDTSLTVTADFAIDGVAPGENLADRFQPKSPGVWELKFARPLAQLDIGTLIVSVRDREGNINRIERAFSVGNAR